MADELLAQFMDACKGCHTDQDSTREYAGCSNANAQVLDQQTSELLAAAGPCSVLMSKLAVSCAQQLASQAS
jgi:3-deoxy-D-arabino-heptulosonate 7-phosphate (DAHP) synthase